MIYRILSPIFFGLCCLYCGFFHFTRGFQYLRITLLTFKSNNHSISNNNQYIEQVTHYLDDGALFHFGVG